MVQKKHFVELIDALQNPKIKAELLKVISSASFLDLSQRSLGDILISRSFANDKLNTTQLFQERVFNGEDERQSFLSLALVCRMKQ